MKARTGRLLLATSLALLLGASGATAVTLDVIDGELVGASGVDVGGTLYDVQFVDGSCIALFSGCDATSDFAFQTQADALAASQALLDQVFLDVPAGDFDFDARLTHGCVFPEGTGSGGKGTPDPSNLPCLVLTPYEWTPGAGRGGPGISFALAENETDGAKGAADGTSLSAGAPMLDTSLDDDRTWAVWSVAVVPEPAVGALLATGLAWGSLRRRR